MKRFGLIITALLLISLQFTCGHSVNNKAQKTSEETDNTRLKSALSEMNEAHADFWLVSFRIDSILSHQGERPKKLKAVRASDPIN